MSKHFEIHQPYFQFGYYDDDFALPKIETYVYLGREQEIFGESRDWLCFQDAESFSRVGPATTASDTKSAEEIAVFSFCERDAESLQDFDGLVRQMRSVSENKP